MLPTLFSSFNGLPLHPLVVHAVVVLVPLSTLGAVLVAARRSWAPAYGPLVTAGAVAAALAAVVAQQAGNALEVQLGYEEPSALLLEHGRHGLYVVNLGIAFAVASVVSLVLTSRLGTTTRWPRVTAWVAAALGVVATVFTFLAGETGAEQVWGYVLDQG
ncbi:DUF2231 domain-containing protein [Aquipuribacter sp. MA13-6]|uniref:DUF2231 domain-containing protein n=1 Tax=unclassified Aquipuribacter TaxID=2635084 RepID=UPI003EEF9F56